ncbi:MAG: hypothetical protein A2525_03790 [Sulfurimonas sp. RIFOXYD12_FULL_36_11]|nr:MAG: hypothetical protein A2525_03790 [Sulfurimonas sp. RIFOXYD12_FULL_36_11]OHE16104.1 MAG: hypothetical protein A2540_07135 [Sulfurimonas sp. RIFOXYD2_FULL_37_8]
MAKKSKLEYFKSEIEELLKKGTSIRSAWKIINYDLPDYAKISYSTFRRFIQNDIISQKKKVQLD